MARSTPAGASTPALSMEALAREAGVAASTVSRALRADPRISAATRGRVQALAQARGYRPNPLVSALMAQLRDGRPPAAKCNLAWLDFFDDPAEWQRDPVQRAFFTGALQRANALGYSLNRLFVGGRNAERVTRVLLSRGVAGLLFPNFDAGGCSAARLPVQVERFTCVGVGTRYEEPFLHYSSDDQYESSRLAVQRLWARGYRRLGYVGDPRIERIVNGRFFAGFHATLRTEFGTEPLPPLITDDETRAPGWVRTRRVDAIVSASRRLYSVLRASRLRIPTDVALAHLNVEDAEGVNGAAPGDIAGVRQDNVGVGANAVDLLVSLLYHNEVGLPRHPRGMQVQGTWVEGATVRPPA